MDLPDEIDDLRERNRRTMRRTLSVASWLYAGVHALFVPLLFFVPAGAEVEGIDGRALLLLMALHLAALAAAGFGLWRPRRWAWTAVLYAAAGALVFAGLMAHLRDPGSAVMFLLYAFLAGAVRLKSTGSA